MCITVPNLGCEVHRNKNCRDDARPSQNQKKSQRENHLQRERYGKKRVRTLMGTFSAPHVKAFCQLGCQKAVQWLSPFGKNTGKIAAILSL
jgi:hypothetical protein